MPLAQYSLSKRVHHDLLASAGEVGELHAAAGELSPALPGHARGGSPCDAVGPVRHGPDQDLEEGLRSQLAGLAVEVGEDELGGSVDSHEEMGDALKRFRASP